MTTMKETTLRSLALLRMIPRFPNSVDVETITSRLSDQGYNVSKRTIQRDLVKLSTQFPITDEKVPGEKASQWFWMEGSEVNEIPEMTPLTALTFSLVESFLRMTLPASVLNYMNPHFKRARSLLGKLNSQHFGRWHEKIRIISRGQRLIPPATDQDVLEKVYQALLEEKQFKAKYRQKGADSAKLYSVHPLGLVFRDEIIYLVCCLWQYNDVKQMALHRFEEIELMEQTRKIPEGFDLDRYIRQGSFSYPINEEKIHLQLRLSENAARHLFETPLSEDQTLKIVDGGVLLSATVQDTTELRWWILGFGDQAEVIKPKALRNDFQTIADNMSRLYQEKMIDQGVELV